MKRSLSIANKIWISLGILITGYVFSMIIGFMYNQSTNTSVALISDDIFPASSQSQKAVSAFKEMIKNYQDAVMTGEGSFLEDAHNAGMILSDSLRSISRLEGLCDTHKSGVFRSQEED